MTLEEKMVKYSISKQKRVSLELSEFIYADNIINYINDFSKKYNLPLDEILLTYKTKSYYGEKEIIGVLEATTCKTISEIELEIKQKEAALAAQEKIELDQLAKLKQKYEGKT